MRASYLLALLFGAGTLACMNVEDAASPASSAGANPSGSAPGGDPKAASGTESPPATAKPAETQADTVHTVPSITEALDWVENDASAALADARENARLLFVDVWAEWCHTCLSMKSTVLAERSLTEFARDFTFLRLDSDNPANAEFLERFEINVWPTFFVLDPNSVTGVDSGVVGYWPGAASLTEMRQFLANSREVGDGLRQQRNPDPLLTHFLRARSAQSEGKSQLALEHFEAAYKEMPAEWPRRSELLLGYIRTLIQRGRFDDCAKLGERHLNEVRGAAIPIQYAKRTFTCLGQSKLPDRKRRVETTLAKMRHIAYSEDPQMSFDDRADALDILTSSLRELGNEQAAKEVSLDRLRLLETAAAAATSPDQARTFDQARAMAYVSVGREQEAISLLTARQKEFPGAASPSSQLSQVYEALGRLTEARQALAHACSLAQGQRKATLLGRSAALARRQKDVPGERDALNEQISELAKLRGSLAQKQMDAARRRLDQLGAPSAP